MRHRQQRLVDFWDWSDGRITRAVLRDSNQQVLWLRTAPTAMSVTYTLRNAAGKLLQTKTVSNAYGRYPHYAAGDGGKLVLLPRLAFALSTNTYYTQRTSVVYTLDGQVAANEHVDYLQRKNGSNRIVDAKTFLDGTAPPIALEDAKGRSLSARAGSTQSLMRGESAVTGFDAVVLP